MKAIELKPIPEDATDFEKVELEIIKVLKRELYLPLLEEINASEKTLLKNSFSDLVDAVSSGRIQFVRGHFEGSFNATISKELRAIGATWDRKQGWWKIPQSELPVDLRAAIGTSESRFKQVSNKVQKKLESIVPADIAAKLRLDQIIDKSIFKAEDKLRQTMKNISVSPQLTPYRRARITEQYTKNMELYITDWTEKEIITLRKAVQKNAFNGNRYEGLVDSIRKSYQVSRNHAKFLARQETNILINTFKQTRYQEAGVNKYRWQTAGGTAQHPVRPMHKKLNGKIFSFDDPPVVNSEGDKKNPGFDFGCRCVAVPIVKF